MFVKMTSLLVAAFLAVYLGGLIDLSYIEEDAKNLFEKDGKSKWQKMIRDFITFVNSGSDSQKQNENGVGEVKDESQSLGVTNHSPKLVTPKHANNR